MSMFSFIGFIAIITLIAIFVLAYAILKKLDEIDEKLKKESSWKPSDEQMKMLAMFANLRCASRREADILESLYNDLKKL